MHASARSSTTTSSASAKPSSASSPRPMGTKNLAFEVVFGRSARRELFHRAGAHERVDALLEGDGRGHRGNVHLGGVVLHVGVVRLDVRGEDEVGLRVLVAAVDLGRI